MAAGSVFVLEALLFLCLIAAVVVLLVRAAGAPGRAVLSRRERKELADLRRLVAEIDKRTYDLRDVNPELAFYVSNLIGEHKNKELEA